MFALAVGGFAIGTTEFVTMGVLPQIADGVGVDIPTAGHLISAYALGVVVGVPILSLFIAGLPRKGLLIGLMGVYGFFNLASALAQNYHQLLVARFFDGIPHGAYFGIASLVAASLSKPENRGRAVAMVMLGLSVANVAGVPFATWLGQQFGWRMPFVVAAALAGLTALMIQLFVPHFPADTEATGRKEAGVFFTNSQVWITMVSGAVGFGGLFAVYSYIANTVTEVGGLSESVVPWFVAAFGLGMVVGTWIAGELSRWSVYGSLMIGGVGTFFVLLVYWVVAPYGWWLWPAAFLTTALGSVLTINLQIRLMDVAGNAVTLGAAMNHAALNTANALGAWVGGLVIAAGYGYRAPALAGAALSVLGIGLLLVAGAMQRATSAQRHRSDTHR
ncbi:MAG: MFS transporter [Nocardioides sp.]